MLNYLIKTLILAVFSFIVIFFYYFGDVSHVENFDWYISYIIIVWIIYSVYKYFQLELSEEKAEFSLIKIFSFFLLHLFVLSILFFTLNDQSIWNWIALFFKIIFFSFIPVSIVLITLSFWRKIVSYLPNAQKESSIYKFIISLWLWFFSFVFLLDIIWILWFYNLYVVFAILIWFIVFAKNELLETFNSIWNYKFEVDIEEGSYLRLLSSEFLFIVSTLVLSVSLISIVRPFPIWWDDLWVYMNFPHLMAEAGSIIALWNMYAWQTFTWIGYMFGSPTQAFFLNNVWGILSFIVLVLAISDLLKSKVKTFVNIPLLTGTIFISLPMVVFQQAKDMKIDPGLFFISIITLYLVLKYYLRLNNISYLEKVKSFVNDKILHKKFNRSNLSIIFVIWLLAWFAFSIKFTSLLLISAIIWLRFYARLGVLWFISYLSIFFAIFTRANLWKMMNVVVNPERIPWFETNFAIVFWLIWVSLLLYTTLKNKIVAKKFFMELGVFLLWIILALLPWLGKNIVESYPKISIWTVISWTSERYKFDSSLIYSDEELKIIEDTKKSRRMSAEWTSGNEDLWRYFGYETWINNYVKLPWNLTMQKNQWWEYTDIWFIFLALLPVVLLFLPFRKKWYAYFIVLLLLLELLTFIPWSNSVIDNSKLSNISSDTKNIVFSGNTLVLKNLNSWKDIFDIKIRNYISINDIKSVVNENNTYESVEKRIMDLFYKELENKVVNSKLWKDIVLLQWKELSDSDFNFIKELRLNYNNYSIFNSEINSINSLEKFIDKNNLWSDKENLIYLWKSNRTINQSISDFFAKFSLPFWYIIILLIFFIPTLYLLFTLNDEKESWKINLFKLNLIFTSFYTFLWAISAFWIVWYWITMYFSFLLAIAISIYYLSSYTNKTSEKEFYIKWFWSLVLSLIIIIYFVNSAIPHSFTNLKWAWYDKYKRWEITTINAPYLYHSEYLKILFHTNILESKRQDFLKEYISEDIKTAVSWIEKMDIFTVRLILNELIKKQPSFARSAKESLTRIYKNISNPNEEYKNTTWIYRIWTFLRYHISENNKRLLEDSLIFTFNDYIYDDNINKTVENLKKLWLEYLLVDLNAATIDKDERHNLTTRFERLLKTFTSDKLELIETDSICLKVALEEFNKSEKFSEDYDRFMTIAWVNYESYTEEWKTIWRWTKLFKCYETINTLIKDEKIDETNYNYLLNINAYVKADENKEKFSDVNNVYKLLQGQVKHGYKVLFRIK